MKLFSALVFLVAASTPATLTAWTPRQGEPPASSRRKILEQAFGSVIAAATTTTTTSLSSPQPAWAGLLDEYGTDPTSKLEKVPTAAAAVSTTTSTQKQSAIEPNLRSNYYYPTNKQRYLPRIKRCSDAIPDVAVSVGRQDWEAVEGFAVKIADDTVLPMRLYTSSLTGGGTNVKYSFTKDMVKCADEFEKCQKRLVVAVKQRDAAATSEALEGLANALQTYRTVGRLLGPDGGGDIPSVDDIRRSARRGEQGRQFAKTVQARDERIKGQSNQLTATSE